MLATMAILPGPAASAENSLFGVAPEVTQRICDGVDHDARWYTEVAGWLELSPAIFDQPVHTETRREIFGNPVLDTQTKQATCERKDEYNDKLKELITKYYKQGNLNTDCGSKDGLQRFIERRLALFDWIAASDWDAPRPADVTCVA
ncbi:hypothetical protein [Nocardia sp. NPDC049149]|uniref:hypothetical protein n=1 Tax=Nocardia sp. NPDC049149 TaxID=3364315 RepID=UPI003722EA27